MREVSVIVPIYNPGKKLNRCIESILDQTFEKFELILVNDGSTDSSLEICKKYAECDSRVKIIDKENEGSILTRKRGVAESIGKYIMFVDSDDWVDNSILEELYNNIIKEDADISVCGLYNVLGDRAIIKKSNMSNYFREQKNI